MKKVLFTATVDSHILHFHVPYLKWFKEQGYEVHVATNGEKEIPYCDKKHIISFERSPIKINNLKAIKDLKKILDKENFEIIHCHTPMGSVVTRLAAKSARKNGTKVIYTAHGFHFFKGAPLLNWLIFYPIEKWLSKYTDCLITINKEDYELAKKKFKAKKVEYVPGVGFNSDKFNIIMTDEDKIQLKKKLNIEPKDIVLSYVAELNANKNQILLINTVKELKKDVTNIKLLLIGSGNLKEYYDEYIRKENLQNNILLLGKRDDIAKLLSITDIYLASSLREGLPVNIMEAMYMGLPIIATDNRGHRELIKNNVNGFLTKNENEIEEKIKRLVSNQILRNRFIKNGKKVINKYIIGNILKDMQLIYKEV